ncbi:MAG: PmoA family protein [Planctomycetia bacterium]|nr:PmoA family protein [Planctomycetia bacterium]
MAIPRCTLIPLPEHQVSFQVDGSERLRWHFGPRYPRPFFYPLVGPLSGLSLTRMGHPGAPDHDHHRSIWFAHEKVSGVNFWSDKTTARVRQKQWLAYQDGEDEAVMAVRLGWNDGHDPKELLEQEVFAAIIPVPDGETLLEIQTTFRPVAEQLEFGKTNFGFLAVRVAKAISAFFGGGTLTNSAGAVGEPNIFGKPAAWMDYSGEQPGKHKEGITYFDHPSNPGHPTVWHVREDGWMGASSCFAAPRTTTKKEPLTLRYLLHAHRGPLDAKRADEVFKAFSRRSEFELVKAPAKHTAFGVKRKG